MSRSSIVSEFLAGLFDRRRTGAGGLDGRPIIDLCEALLSTKGQVSGRQIAAAIFARYGQLDTAGQLAFFSYLNDCLDLDAGLVSTLAANYAATGSPEQFHALSRAAEPKRQELFRRLNQAEGATASLVKMRVDLLGHLKTHPDLGRTDIDLVHLLRSWFNRGFLVLKQINWSSPANTLEKIVAYEAVHEIRDWGDLRRRLHPPDRRCFAFFHPAMPDEPLIFVEVALTQDVPGSIQSVLAEDRAPLVIDDARTAVFYSISNCQQGLAGISFGNLLIKQVASELAQELPQLTTFVTLSPIPGLAHWVEHWAEQQEATDPPLHIDADLAAHYLIDAKRDDGLPVDPVARFHLGNGAAVYEVHENADTTAKSRAQSGGVMVNYLYDLALTERNHEDFAINQTVAASKSIRANARAAQQRIKTTPSSKT